MATLNAQAIRTAIRECLTGTLAGTRAPTAGYASDDMFTGADDYVKAMRSIIKPTFDVRIDSIKRQEDTPNEITNLRLYELSITVTTTYKSEDPVLGVTLYEEIKADAETDVDIFMRALGWPGALTQTAAAAETGLVSGLLRNTGSVVTNDDPEQCLYEYEMTFEAIALVNVNA